MLTPASTDPQIAIPLRDLTRRASVAEFLHAVSAYIPTLTLSEDQALALAYLLAAQERISPENGSRVRRGLAAAQGHEEDDLADLLALGYCHLFPMLAPSLDDYPDGPESPAPTSATPRRRLRDLFTRRGK